MIFLDSRSTRWLRHVPTTFPVLLMEHMICRPTTRGKGVRDRGLVRGLTRTNVERGRFTNSTATTTPLMFQILGGHRTE
jgi:hypothetical protein